MKRIFIGLSLCFFGISMQAQSLELKIDAKVITPGDTVYVRGLVDENHDYLKVYFLLRNTTTSDLILSGSKNVSYIHPDALETWCGFNTCWEGPSVSNLKLAASSTHGTDSAFYGEFIPESTLKEAWIEYAFWVSDQENNRVSVHVNFIPTQTNANKDNKAATKLSFFPNPAADFVQINGIEGPSMISIYNTQGVLMRSIEQSEEAIISLKGLPKGLYLLRIQNARTQQTLKLLIP